jgi:hypothetical protein
VHFEDLPGLAFIPSGDDTDQIVLPQLDANGLALASLLSPLVSNFRHD